VRRSEADGLVKRLEAAYPGEMVEGTAEEYVKVLLPLTKDLAERVIDRAIRESPWRPKVADLIKAQRDLERPKSKVADGIHQVARIRGISYDEARAATVAQLRMNHHAEPEGGWQHHLEALGETV
jgi:hypothetical protein